MGVSSVEEKQESGETTAAEPTFLRSLEEPQRSIDPASRGTNAAGAKEVLVWWDIETCPITSSVAASSYSCLFHELQSRTSSNICVTINVYGNAGPDSKAPLDALVAGGITLQHRILPCKQPGSESAALKAMVVDMALWALATPAPADVFLISAARDAGLRELATGLHLRGYTVHVATRLAFGEEEQLFRPMPRHWSVSKQMFVARTVQIPEQLAQLHLRS